MARGLLGVTFAALSHRFQIQDIVAQDQFGVVFHALDVATGKPVAVRRFFPFGVDGGGLFDEERKGYDLAPLLPALWHNLGAVTAKIRIDYNDVVTTLLEQRYFIPVFR